MIWSCLALPNADRACSEAACALKKAAWAPSKAAKALKKLVRVSSAAAFLGKSFSSQLDFGMRVKALLEMVVRM